MHDLLLRISCYGLRQIREMTSGKCTSIDLKVRNVENKEAEDCKSKTGSTLITGDKITVFQHSVISPIKKQQGYFLLHKMNEESIMKLVPHANKSLF